MQPTAWLPAVTATSPADTAARPPRLAHGTTPPDHGVQLSPAAIPMPLLRPLPARATAPYRPRAQIGLALIYALLALMLAPLAPIAWLFAAEQIELVERGARRPSGITLLRIAHGVGIAMTLIAVAATAFAATVLAARLV